MPTTINGGVVPDQTTQTAGFNGITPTGDISGSFFTKSLWALAGEAGVSRINNILGAVDIESAGTDFDITDFVDTITINLTGGGLQVLNGLEGAVNITAGAGMSVTPAGTGNITIANTGVLTLNSLAGNVALLQGTGTQISINGQSITLSATGAAGSVPVLTSAQYSGIYRVNGVLTNGNMTQMPANGGIGTACFVLSDELITIFTAGLPGTILMYFPNLFGNIQTFVGGDQPTTGNMSLGILQANGNLGLTLPNETLRWPPNSPSFPSRSTFLYTFGSFGKVFLDIAAVRAACGVPYNVTSIGNPQPISGLGYNFVYINGANQPIAECGTPLIFDAVWYPGGVVA